MVGEREGHRGAGIQLLAAHLHLHLDQAGLAQGAVDVHGITDRGDAIFGDDDDVLAVTLGGVDQQAADTVDLLEILDQPGVGEVRAEPLQVVVEVRQVAERQRRLARLHDV